MAAAAVLIKSATINASPFTAASTTTTATIATNKNSMNAAMSSNNVHHQNQLTRSLERILEEAHVSGELKLSGRKLKDFPKAAGKYNLNDTVIAGEYFQLSLSHVHVCVCMCVWFWCIVVATILKSIGLRACMVPVYIYK